MRTHKQPCRLDTGGSSIQRGKPLRFSFDGKSYTGFEGDTLASALLANGKHLVGRSFKYHRPRGILTASSEEPNALVELRKGAFREPNTRATTIELFEGLVAKSQNRFPSLAFDVLSVNQLFSRFMGAGFYYKTFMWPSSFWEPVYEKFIRRAAGLGRAATLPDPDRYEHAHHHCDVLVIGGGAAGLAAALSAGRSGARVILAEETPRLGGSLSRTDIIDGAPADEWVRNTRRALEALPETQIKTRFCVFGYYDNNIFAAIERVGDHLAATPKHLPRQRLHTIRARKVIFATGALERPVVFDNNDIPGVMLSSAVRCYVDRFAVAPGKSVAIATNNDDAYHTAFALLDAGINIPVLADARLAPSALSERARQLGIRVQHAMLPQCAHGSHRVTALSLQRTDGAFAERVRCDCIGVSGGYSPNVSLISQRGERPRWREDILAFVPETNKTEDIGCAGACHGVFDLNACLQDGFDMGERTAKELGFDVDTQTAPSAPSQEAGAIHPLWRCPGNGKAFVDFQNDVTADDIHLANREGYSSVEHLKRYTTLGMATDQGRTSNVNGLAILALAQGKSIPEVGTTRYRPPAVPVAIGAFAGHERGKNFQPVRRTAMHACHEKFGAVFVEAGQWMRPRYYPELGENMEAAIWREAKLVRENVGVCDVSTLGKIELFGEDAAEFLNRLYINGWSKLPVGKARYGLMLREDGAVFDDGTTSRLGNNHFLMTTTTANAAAVLAHMEKYAQTVWRDLDVHFCSATEQWCGVSVAGPLARETLKAVFKGAVDLSNEALPFMGVREFVWNGTTARIFRISFSGELAYEVNVPWGYGEAMWERIMDAGRAFNIIPYGTEALGVLRIEKGHVAGSELDGRTTATDMGLGSMLSSKKQFIGLPLSRREGMTSPKRPSLVGVKPVKPKQRLRGGAHFVTDIAKKGKIESLGWISSVADSPAVGCWIGLGYIQGGHTRIGEKVTAWYPMKNEMIEVEICDPVFVDPKGERLHG
ncbi:MAG: sarcosine oxidase subunit alpha family protein [Hyphomicrobiales bacterium]|nr:sarcosine oxidase subunit alpha family protein [Hyphomicrobiales bacterium]